MITSHFFRCRQSTSSNLQLPATDNHRPSSIRSHVRYSFMASYTGYWQFWCRPNSYTDALSWRSIPNWTDTSDVYIQRCSWKYGHLQIYRECNPKYVWTCDVMWCDELFFLLNILYIYQNANIKQTVYYYSKSINHKSVKYVSCFNTDQMFINNCIYGQRYCKIIFLFQICRGSSLKFSRNFK